MLQCGDRLRHSFLHESVRHLGRILGESDAALVVDDDDAGLRPKDVGQHVHSAGRGTLRDALTQFDECGVVVAGTAPDLWRALGELVDFDLSPWPNVQAWVAHMKARPAWPA